MGLGHQGLKDALERHRGTRANSKVSSVFGRVGGLSCQAA